MILSWLFHQNKRQSQFFPRGHRRGDRPRSYRPRLEWLEDRLVPAEFNVNVLADVGAGSLRQAIIGINGSGDAANAININVNGVINLNSALPTLSKNVTIAGPGQNNLTVQRSLAVGTPDFGVFHVGAGVTVTFSGMTIANGRTAEDGGGILNDGGTVTVVSCTVSGNSAADGGGGIASNSTLTITDSDVNGNTALRGGGIANSGTLTVVNSSIWDNTATQGGGGIFNIDPGASVLVHRSTISFNNGGAGGGGGILNKTGGTVTVTDRSTISGNSGLLGGGIRNEEFATVTVTDSTVRDNLAAAGGGLFNSGTMTLINTDVTANTALVGGGLFNGLGGLVTRVNTTINGNLALFFANILNLGTLVP